MKAKVFTGALALMTALLCGGCGGAAPIEIDRMRYEPVRTVNIGLEGIDDPDMYDTLGYLYYKGSFYSTNLPMTEAAADMPMEDLIGHEVGESVGSLADWASQSDDSTSFAGTFRGTVYTMKGYDESFRLIIRGPGSESVSWAVMENYDDIELRCGQDLFETRLHLTSRIKSAEAESMDGKRVKVSVKKVTALLSAACAAQVESIPWADQFRRRKECKTGWLNLEIEDGTRVRLYLEEGGFVTYASLPACSVVIPGRAFDAVFKAIPAAKPKS